MQKIFTTNIEKNTVENIVYRKVLHTTNKMQLVIMSIPPLSYISLEIHPTHDQFIKIEHGECVVLIYDGNKILIDKIQLQSGWSIIIPANTWHEVKNLSSLMPVKLYTIYTPPEHKKDRLDVDNPDLHKHAICTNKYKLVLTHKK